MSQQVRDAINFHPKYEEYKQKYHSELREGYFKVRLSEKVLKCPFCPDSRDYGYIDLLRHANRIVKESKSASFKEKAKHMGLIEYLERDFHAKIKTSELANEELLVWPWMAVIVNIPVDYENITGKKLKDELIEEGYKPVEVHLLLNSPSHSGIALVEFGKTWDGFYHVIAFMKAFEVNRRGRKDWFDSRKCNNDKLYAWIATDKDYNSSGLVGDYLRKNSDLKTVADVQKEEEPMILGLKTMINEMDKTTEEMTSKISKIDVQLETAMKEREEMAENFKRDMELMEKEAKQHLKTISTEHNRTKCLLEDREKGLRAREAIVETEKKKLDNEKRKNKVDDQVWKPAENQQGEIEKLYQTIIELQKKLDEKHWMELTIEELKGALEVIKHMTDKRIEAKNRIELINKDLEEKKVKHKDLELLNTTLMVKERKSNDESVEARKELISGLKENTSPAHVIVKRIGVLNDAPFVAAAKKHYSGKEGHQNAIKLVSLWENHLSDLSWHPFKIITVDGKSEILDEDDEKITSLKDEYGKDVYDAVITALKELNEYNPNGRYPVLQLWNKMEERRATLKEAVEVLLDLWKVVKPPKKKSKKVSV